MIIWYGPPYSYSGYGLHNRKLVLELDRLGIDVKLIPTEEHIPEELAEKEDLERLTKKHLNNDPHNIVINCVPPPSVPYRADYNILYTTLECRDLHWGAKIRSSYYDEVWVPCRQNYKAYRRAGFKRSKLFIMPEGVDTEFHNYLSGPLEECTSPAFTFLFVGDWSYRKGIPFLLQAYAQEFSPEENVRLLLLVHYQGQDEKFSEKRILHEFKFFKKQKEIFDSPPVEFIFSYPPDTELSKIYNSVNCYVSPSLGEAWNLPVIQAMSHSLPVITTNYGGMAHYCTKKNSYLIDVLKFDTMHDKTILTVDFYQGQKFAFPDVRHLRTLMRSVFDDPAEGRKRGHRARRDCVENWTWESAAKKIIKRLQKIQRKL